jgi:hypothetical protein
MGLTIRPIVVPEMDPEAAARPRGPKSLISFTRSSPIYRLPKDACAPFGMPQKHRDTKIEGRDLIAT